MIASIKDVVKQYNWRGSFVGYRFDGTFVPADERNTDFQLLLERIKRGECSEHEPKFSWAKKVHREDGEVSGYDTDLGFVPNDHTNALHQFLQQSMSAGTIVVEEPMIVADAEKISTLVICKIFDRKWQPLQGSIEKPFPYIPHSQEGGLELLVRIRNIPPNAEDIIGRMRESFGLARDIQEVTLYKPLQFGAIEVEVPTRQLQKIFRREKHRLPTTIAPFVEDSLALHLVRSGRSARKGPNLQWLLAEARYFLTGLFADIANMAIRAFTLEFGGLPPGHLLEDDLLRSHLLFARYEKGELRLHSMQFQAGHDFALTSCWPEGRTGMVLRDPIMRKRQDFWDIASRVRQLISAGFAIEALLVANALIETVLKEALIAMCSDEEAQLRLDRMRHADRLDLLSVLVKNEAHTSLSSDQFREFLDSIIEIYQARNNYAHELTLPVEDSWKIADMDRLANRLLRFFLDPHVASITVGALSSLATSPTERAIALIHSELDRRISRRWWNSLAEWLYTTLSRLLSKPGAHFRRK
jgi:hypothetical protein